MNFNWKFGQDRIWHFLHISSKHLDLQGQKSTFILKLYSLEDIWVLGILPVWRIGELANIHISKTGNTGDSHGTACPSWWWPITATPPSASHPPVDCTPPATCPNLAGYVKHHTDQWPLQCIGARRCNSSRELRKYISRERALCKEKGNSKLNSNSTSFPPYMSSSAILRTAAYSTYIFVLLPPLPQVQRQLRRCGGRSTFKQGILKRQRVGNMPCHCRHLCFPFWKYDCSLIRRITKLAKFPVLRCPHNFSHLTGTMKECDL